MKRPPFRLRCFAIVGLLMLPTLSMSTAAELLESPRVFAAGPYWNTHWPIAVPGDVNGDGHLDVVGVIREGLSVTVLIGDGHGAFSEPLRYPPEGNWAEDLALADLDGDGDLDIALAESLDPNTAERSPEGCVAILFGYGDGTFAEPILLETGLNPNAVEAGDLDADGDLDLVVVNGGSADIAVLNNDGDGQFELSHRCPVGDSPAFLEIGDLDQNGTLDLATSNEEGDTLTIRFGTGTGTFSSGPTLPSGQCPQGIDIGDYNVDGLLDLAVSSEDSNELMVYLGTGGGEFEQSAMLPASGRWVRSNDIDSDGFPDLICTDWWYSLRIFFGRGDGSFDDPVLLENAGSTVFSVECGDVNEDGRPDLLATAYATNLVVLINQGRGTYFNPIWNRSVDGYNTLADLGDINSDGALDAVIRGDDGVAALLGHGDGSFAGPQYWSMGSHMVAVLLRDLNGDGHLDLLTGNYFYVNGVRVRLGAGDGSFGELIETVEYGSPRDIVCGDLNGDEVPDIVVVDTADEEIAAFLGNGDGTFVRYAAAAVGEEPRFADLGDFDDDGDLDLAVSNYEGESISILLGNGDGSFGFETQYESGSHPENVVIADLTNDGNLDVAVIGWGLEVFPGVGDGTLNEPVFYEASVLPSALAVGDLDGNGRQDVVLGSWEWGAITVLVNGHEETPLDVLGQHNACEIALGDLNNDTHLDVVVAGLGGLDILLNNARRYSTVTADLNCVPASGMLPFSCRFRCSLRNHWHGKRRMHAGVDAQLADGTLFENWRSADVVLDDVEERHYSWTQNLPAHPWLAGDNIFRFRATDISPAPFNQPPYPASGWTGNDECVVEGILPAH